ncbi:MAG: hypothetical protein M1838_001261 [Thelocarpon superellum]|nr:MAG: hypothetical protein M1838_001261 [Thelocarpon superellum]
MQDLIDKYFISHLSLPLKDAAKLRQDYYQQYGLALEGLVRHHTIDPMEYNRQVDDALPLENVIHEDQQLRALLEDIDQSKIRLWLFTNAYVTHGKRVVHLLGVDDLFDGMTYCNYSAERLVCKPHAEMFAKAQHEAGAVSPADCFFVDDSFLNCQKAHELGWTAAHLLEPEDPEPPVRAAKHQIRSLEELRTLFPQFFKSSGNGTKT